MNLNRRDGECFVSRGLATRGRGRQKAIHLSRIIKAPLGREKPAVAVTKITIRGQTSGEHLGIAAEGAVPAVAIEKQLPLRAFAPVVMDAGAVKTRA